PPPTSTRFPYTTLFRSRRGARQRPKVAQAAPVVVPVAEEVPVLICLRAPLRADREAAGPVVQDHPAAVVEQIPAVAREQPVVERDRKSTRLNFSHRTSS